MLQMIYHIYRFIVIYILFFNPFLLTGICNGRWIFHYKDFENIVL